MERNDDDDDDGQNAGKRCQARIILEWKEACESGREGVPPRRRQPFTCKSSTSFLHITPFARRSLHFPMIFLSRSQFADFHLLIFFFFSFPHLFFAAWFSQYGARDRVGRAGMGLKQWNVRRDDFNTYSRGRDGPR